MKVLVVTPHYFPESFSTQLFCEHLAKNGNEVTVVTSLPSYGSRIYYPGYSKAFLEVHNNVNIIRVKASPRKGGVLSLLKNYLSFFCGSIHAVRHLKGEYSVVLSFCLSPITSIASAGIYSKKHHIPHLHYCLDVWPESAVSTGYVKRKSLLYLFSLLISRNLYKKCNKILVSSPSFTDYLTSTDRFPKQNISLLYQPCFEYQISQSEPLLKSSKNLVYAGNFGKLQMVDSLVKAVDLLPDDTPVSLVLIGDGSQRNEVMNAIKGAKHQNRIIYLGRMSSERAYAYCQRATAVIVSLKDDGSIVSKTIPNKLITGFSLGKPIIACLHGDGLALLKEAGGFVEASSSPESLSQAFLRVAGMDSKELEKLGRKNRIFYDQKLSNEAIFSSFDRQIMDLVG